MLKAAVNPVRCGIAEKFKTLICISLPNKRQKNKYRKLTIHNSHDSDDDFRSGCGNVGQCHQQQSFSGPLSPGRSNHTNKRYYCLIPGSTEYYSQFSAIPRLTRLIRPLWLSCRKQYLSPSLTKATDICPETC